MKGTLHPEARADASNEPFMVCALRAANGLFNYALGRAELHRETTWTYDVLSRMGVTAGAPVTVIASGAEAIPALIIENALTRLRAPWITIEDAPMDVARWAMFLKAVGPQGSIGGSPETFSALLELDDHMLDQLAGLPVLAVHAASLPLFEKIGLSPWGMFRVGPLTAWQEAGQKGFAYDESEWLVEEIAGRLWVSALQPRLTPIIRLATPALGAIEVVDGRRLIHPTSSN